VQMAGLPWSAWERLIVWLIAGFAIYFLYGRSRARRMRVVHAARAAGPAMSSATDP